MVQLKLISVGSLKEKYLADALEEYKKRLSQYARVEEISLKEERIANEDNAAEIREALEREGERILKAAPDDHFKIALCVEGVQYDSIALAHLIESAADRSGKLCLIIGSSHGLSEKVKRCADVRLSFSKMTFPHQLMRVMLAEALYRSFTIIDGKRYHK